ETTDALALATVSRGERQRCTGPRLAYVYLLSGGARRHRGPSVDSEDSGPVGTPFSPASTQVRYDPQIASSNAYLVVGTSGDISFFSEVGDLIHSLTQCASHAYNDTA